MIEAVGPLKCRDTRDGLVSCKATSGTASPFRLDAACVKGWLGERMFQTLQDLKSEISALEPEEFFDQHVVGGQSAYLNPENIAFLCELFSDGFDVEVAPADVIMVGSAKLGFALHAKRTPSFTLEAFRPYSAVSDIDLSICNPALFRKIWHELSAHACVQPILPWNPDKLADYMMYGWLRPDKFPKGQALMYCDRFYETIGRFRRDRGRGQPRATAALYYSVEHLRRYQARGIRLCKQKLEVAR